jgi:predicted aminopeptidase
MKLFKRILFFLLIVLIITALSYRKLICYGVAQLSGQLHIIYNAQPVSEVMADPSTPDSIKQKLVLIESIRKYAVDSLGLKESKNYTSFYNQHGKPVLWVITACEPFSMKAIEWHFPFLGNVSYKGFFEKERGIPELEELKTKGYDTEYSPAGGWSTLGWFNDPILSNMLRRHEGQIAELIIHELTHATVYLPGSVEYNENLATFIGEQGAKRFLSNRYGSDSKELDTYLFSLEDEQLYGDYMVKACQRLDSFYRKMPVRMDETERKKQKYVFIRGIIKGISDLPLHRPEFYIFKFPEDKLPNNAWFMNFSRYRNKQVDFQKDLLRNHNDLKALIHEIAERTQ